MLALFGVSFLTPLDALFVLAAAVPLAALLLTERRSARVRRGFAKWGPEVAAALRSRRFVTCLHGLPEPQSRIQRILKAALGDLQSCPVAVHNQISL